MRLALFWSEILHCHAARIRALDILALDQGFSIVPFALRSSSPELPVPGYQDLLKGKVHILSTGPDLAGLSCKIGFRVIDFLDQHQPDVVGIPGYSDPTVLSALAWCRKYRRGAILMSDSKADDYGRTALKEMVKRRLVPCFDAALVGGSPQIAYALDLGMNAHQVFSGVDAVDNEFWSGRSDEIRAESEDWRTRLGLPRHFFLTACRLVPNKNLDGLLRAYKSYSNLGHGAWPLVIAGDGRLKGELERLAYQLGVSEQVRFVGYLSTDEIAPYYALASVFILATSISETWGLVVSEAMASGVPVLVSKICGCVPDLVIEGQTGYSFNPKDEVALANLMLVCSNGRLDLMSMGRSARTQVEQFSPNVFAGNFFNAAKVAIELARGRRGALTCRLYLFAVRSALRLPTAKLE